MLKREYEISSEDEENIIRGIHSDGVFLIKVNNNKPNFEDDEIERLKEISNPFSELDGLRRCGVAFACISKDTVSSDNDNRPKIHSKPLGFPESKEENTVNGRLIFQRCHLIGYHVFKKRNDKGEENANLKKIFVGTRFMNNLMFYYEKKIYEYVHKTENRVLYRVTPYFNDSDKLVYGVQMEAMFINESGNEDKNLSFNVFVYNKQPYIQFDYGTGKDFSNKMPNMECNYVIDKKKKKFHINGCASVMDFGDDRTDKLSGRRKKIIQDGYHPCAICDPGN